MQSVADLYVPLQRLISIASGVDTVIRANQGRAAPDGLYATYNPIPVRAVGSPRRVRGDIPAVDTDLPDWLDYQESTTTQMDFLLSVNFFNEGSSDAAWNLHNANFRWPVQGLLHTYQIGWRDCSEVRDLTGLMQASLQPRYQVDVRLYIEAAVTDVVLRAAGFQLQVSDESGNLLYDGVSEQ